MPAWLTQIALAVGFVSVLPGAVFGQGGIGGVVRDTGGGVLPGVSVEAASAALIERVRTVVTDENGQYLIVGLRPGVYTVTFTLAGFTTLKRDGLEVTTGVTLPVNAELKVGAIQETVTVTTATPVVDIENTRQQTVMSRDLLDAIPRGRLQQQSGRLLPGVVFGGNQSDVGGSSGEVTSQMAIHGGDSNDQIWAVDGMKISQGGYGARRMLIVADNTAQEYTYETGAHSAEIPSGGILMNLVPKEGGNTFKGILSGAFTTQGMTSDNLSADLKARGLTSTTRVDKIWDISPALGGPVLRDRLWFFTTYRSWGANNFPAGAFYLLDPTRPAESINRYWTVNARLTWQASQRNKFNIYDDEQGHYIPYFGVSNLVPPETATGHYTPPGGMRLTQAKWNSPVTSRLLLEAAGYHYLEIQNLTSSPASRLQSWEPEPADPLAWPTFEITTGKWIAGSLTDAGFFPSNTTASWWGASSALSYITGSHAFKVGFTHTSGTYFSQYPPVPPILRMLNGVPFQVEFVDKPGVSKPRLNHDLGVYVQDQWTLRRLTLNLGGRFDYFDGQVDAQYAPAGQWFLPVRNLPEIPNVPDWKDLSPRLGLAYDLFGNGKTAVKTSLSRYIKSDMTTFQGQVNPMGSAFVAGLTDIRTWTDLNGDRLPQVNELGPSTNLNFGTFSLNTVPDEQVRSGWDKRPYNWEYVASIQQQLLPRLSLNVGYFRRWFGNLTWTNNLSVQTGDYMPFTILSPLNGEQITEYNLSPAKRGLSNNLIEFAPNNSQVFSGIDILVNGRFGHGGLVGGGVSMGRTVTSTCTTSDPNTLRFCNVTPPFIAGNSYTFIASYPLPYDLQVSGTFQSNPGPLITANYTVSSAIAGLPLTNGSLAVNLVQPGTLYGDRANRADFRFGKKLRVRATQFQPYVDLLNVLNASPVIALNNTYGPAWQRPLQILVGRVVQVGIQVMF